MAKATRPGNDSRSSPWLARLLMSLAAWVVAFLVVLALFTDDCAIPRVEDVEWSVIFARRARLRKRLKRSAYPRFLVNERSGVRFPSPAPHTL